MKIVFTSEKKSTTITQDLSPMLEYTEVDSFEIAQEASLKVSKVWGVSPLWEWSDCIWEIVAD